MHNVLRYYQQYVLVKTVPIGLSVNMTYRNKVRSTIRSWAPEAIMIIFTTCSKKRDWNNNNILKT